MQPFDDPSHPPVGPFLMRDAQPLADPDRITDPLCLTQPSFGSRIRRAVRQAGEALAIISAIVAVGFAYASF